jgi:hypothetical protein
MEGGVKFIPRGGGSRFFVGGQPFCDIFMSFPIIPIVLIRSFIPAKLCHSLNLEEIPPCSSSCKGSGLLQLAQKFLHFAGGVLIPLPQGHGNALG